MGGSREGRILDLSLDRSLDLGLIRSADTKFDEKSDSFWCNFRGFAPIANL